MKIVLSQKYHICANMSQTTWNQAPSCDLVGFKLNLWNQAYVKLLQNFDHIIEIGYLLEWLLKLLSITVS